MTSVLLAQAGNDQPSCPRNTTSHGGGIVRDVLESLTRSYIELGDLTRAGENYQKLAKVGHLQNVLLVRQVGGGDEGDLGVMKLSYQD